jgi:hypothetical protein
VSKIVRIGSNDFVLWAGSPVVARLIISNLTHRVANGNYESLDEVISSLNLNSSEKSSVDLIYAKYSQGRTFIEKFGDVAFHEEGALQRWTAGTGVWPFFDEKKPLLYKEDPEFIPKILLNAITSQIGRTIFLEGLNQHNLNFGFGGWFDLVLLGPFGARRIPYSIKCWIWDGKKLGSAWPMIFSMYIDDALYICSVSAVSKRYKTVHVPEVVNQNSVSVKLAQYYYDPVFQIHVVFDSPTGNIFIDGQPGKSDAVGVKFFENGLLPVVSDKYTEYLERNIPNLSKRIPFDGFYREIRG